MQNRVAAVVAAFIGVLAAVAPAQASLIGQGFNVSYRIPDLGTVYSDASASPADFLVGAGWRDRGQCRGRHRPGR